MADFMLTVTKILDTHPQRIAENLTPQFTALRNEVDTMKASFNEVKNEVTKLKEGVQTITEAQKASHGATTKALKAFAEKAEALEAFLGESQLGYEGDEKRTLMGRLDEMYLALGDVLEKMADREADGVWFSMLAG